MISTRQIKPSQRQALALRSDATIPTTVGAWRTLMTRRVGTALTQPIIGVHVGYDFETDLNPSEQTQGAIGTIIANASLTSMTITAGLGYTNDPQVLVCNPPTATTDATSAVANASYLSFTVNPKPTTTFTTLTFNAARGGASTPRGYVVRSSNDSFAANLATADLNTQRTTFTAVSVDISAIPNTAPVTFRIYFYVPSAGNSIDIDNISVNGTGTNFPKDIRDLEVAFLRANGGTGDNLLDLWGTYLTSKGMTGSPREKLKSFFKSTSTTV